VRGGEAGEEQKKRRQETREGLGGAEEQSRGTEGRRGRADEEGEKERDTQTDRKGRRTEGQTE
jgi:hypothetical protein